MTPLLRLLAALPFFLLASCASVSVDRQTERSSSGMPERIYVERFATEDSDFRVDREGKELAVFKRSLQDMMQKGIVTDLSRRLAPADQAGASIPNGKAWLIRGKFTKIHQGSRFLRGALGFGAGRTRFETRVFVYDLRQGPKGMDKPLLSFSTIGGSGAEPGAVTAIATDPVTIVVEAAAGGAGGIAHGLTEDTSRTAREITAALSDYLYRHGALAEEKWIAPKTTRGPREGPER